MKLSVLLSGILLSGSFLYVSARDFVLVKNGKSEVSLVKNARIGNEQKHFVREMGKCGIDLPLADRSKLLNGKKIVFEIKELPIEKEDAFTIDFPDEKTMRIVCTPVSARWAVNHIMEKVFKVRYLFPHVAEYGAGDVNEYPKAVNVSVKAEKFESKPHSFFLHRTLDWHCREFMANFGSKSTIVGTHFITVDVFPVWKYAPDQSWPREILPVLRGRKYIPPKPAKLPLSSNPYLAKRGYDVFWNPCFTNPATTEIAIRDIMETLKKNPGKREIYMGLNDNGGMCTCPNCRKAVAGKRNSNNFADWSVPYWTWVHKVAEAVSPHYPNVWFAASSYREAMDPPPFKLHPKVVVKICFEIYGMRNPETAAKRHDLMKKWSESCRNLIFYDYCYGTQAYLLPRPTFRHHNRILKEFYRKYHVVGLSQETSVTTPFEGPKHYHLFRLMQDINTDPDQAVREWCVAAVGEKASKPLRQYYAFWDNYWMGDDITKTLWFSTNKNIYLQLGERSTHTFALKEGDMAYCRKLLEQTVALAQTPSQKRRARILLQYFELSELAAQALFSEVISPEGKLKTVNDAVKLLRQVPRALAALDKLAKHPLKKYFAQDLKGNMFSNLGLVMPYIKETAVRRELEKLASDPKLDRLLRCQIRIWLGAKAQNLVRNGSFESADSLPTAWGGGKQQSRRNHDYAHTGKYSLGRKGHISVEYGFPAQPGKTYLAIFSAFTPEGSAEGRLNYMLTPRRGKRNADHIRYLNITLPGGKWQTYVGSFTVRQRGNPDNFLLNIWTDKFEKDELILIDDVQVYCLDDLNMQAD